MSAMVLKWRPSSLCLWNQAERLAMIWNGHFIDSQTFSSQFLAMMSLDMRWGSASSAVNAKKLPNFGGCLPVGKMVDP